MLKVLIVDDEVSILQSTAGILSDLGFRTVTVSSAPLILPTLRAEKPDVLLQDVRMPGLSLSEVIGEIRRGEQRHLPIVLFSASISLPDLEDVFDVDAIVEKPFRPDVLVEALHAAMAKRAPSAAPA